MLGDLAWEPCLETFGNLAWEPGLGTFLGTVPGNLETLAIRILAAPTCSGTFTMAEDPKLTLLGKNLILPAVSCHRCHQPGVGFSDRDLVRRGTIDKLHGLRWEPWWEACLQGDLPSSSW